MARLQGCAMLLACCETRGRIPRLERYMGELMHKTILAVVAACVLGLATAAPAAETQPSYSAVFEALWKTVDENFYDPHFHGVDWQEAKARYGAKLSAVHSDHAFQALADAMLGELKTSHTYLAPPSGSPASSVGIG